MIKIKFILSSLTLFLIILNIAPIATASTTYNFTTFNVPGAVASSVYVNGIDNSGNIVGTYTDASGGHYGFLFNDTTQAYTTLNYPGGVEVTEAHGINELGYIVGSYLDTSGHSFLYDGSSYATIGPSWGGNIAIDINDLGEVVGESAGHGYLYNGSTYSQLDFPGSSWTTAHGINNAGQIVGKYLNGSGLEVSYIYATGVYTALDIPGAFYHQANDINNNGQIVGSYDGTHGYIYDGFGFNTIDFPGATGTGIFGINDLGQIVGLYNDSSGATYFFIATPVVPEPISSILFVTGGALLAGRRFLKRKT